MVNSAPVRMPASILLASVMFLMAAVTVVAMARNALVWEAAAVAVVELADPAAAVRACHPPGVHITFLLAAIV